MSIVASGSQTTGSIVQWHWVPIWTRVASHSSTNRCSTPCIQVAAVGPWIQTLHYKAPQSITAGRGPSKASLLQPFCSVTIERGWKKWFDWEWHTIREWEWETFAPSKAQWRRNWVMGCLSWSNGIRKKKVEAGHPQSIQSCMPQALRKAVAGNANTTEGQVSHWTDEKVEKWAILNRMR